MFYQAIDVSEELYFVKKCSLGEYPLHWHSDLEILFCLHGELIVRVDEETYHVTEGQTLMIGSSLPHAYLPSEGDNQVVLLRVGSLFLGETLFSEVARKQFLTAVIGKNEEIAIASGLIKGNADGTLNPLGNTTRAETAVICQHILER